jgi:uncharacterized protein YecE (DUF72 family)
MGTPTSVGRFRSGTSGFAYPAWAPRFYPAGIRADARLPAYAARLDACELNNTFYRRPSRTQLRRWREAVPGDFRFAVKAQRGASLRILRGDPGAVDWLTADLDELGASLGCVLFRVPADVVRDDAALRSVLERWPPSIPLAMELQSQSWHVDETFAALRAAGAVLCATDTDGAPPPDLRVTGPFLYARLRRMADEPSAMAAWAERFVPFLEAGLDVYAFLRHDADGSSGLSAASLAATVDERLAALRASVSGGGSVAGGATAVGQARRPVR